MPSHANQDITRIPRQSYPLSPDCAENSGKIPRTQTHHGYGINGIDRNDAPLVGCFVVPENCEKRKGGGHDTDPRHDKPLNAQEERFYRNVTKR